MAEKKKFGVWKIILIVIGVSILISVFSNIDGESKPAATTAQEEAEPQIAINREEIWNDFKSGNIKTIEEYGLKSDEEWQAIIDEEMERENQEILIRYAELLETVKKDEAYNTIKEEFGIDNLDLDLILALEEDRIKEERRELVETAFSAWDGSHIALAAFIKENMNNPKSYDHVKTTYRDDGDYITVQTTFRGTNAFNAVVSNTVTAKCSLDGQVLEVIDQE